MKTVLFGLTAVWALLAQGCSEDAGSSGNTAGSTNAATGGSTNAATGGSTNAATGGSTNAATGGGTSTSTGGSANTATGGSTGTSTGGKSSTSTGGTTGTTTGGSMGSGGAGGTAASGTDALVWRTGEFSLEPGQERYLCFASTLDEALTANAYSTSGRPFVHHIIFARTRSPAPDGFSECGTGFQTSWDPLFITGAGASTLQFPSDAGHVLTKGTQLLVQLHLLNLGKEAVKGDLEINLHRSSVVNPRPVNTYIVGTMNVNLPPMQEGQVVANCNAREKVELIAAFPHMHMLGRSMRFEVGKGTDPMTSVFVREPFDFNDQRMDKVAISLAQNDKLRLTCKYQNTNATAVTYGESSLNEMCYLIGFAIDRSSQGSCIQ